MENNTFKGSLFGGFNRQDVMNYIEKASKESAQLLEENAARIAALEQDVKTKGEELDALRAERDRLQSDLKDACASYQATQSELDAAQEAYADLNEALETARTYSRNYAEEIRTQKSTIEALQVEVEEYHTLKNNIAEVELDARHRADTIVADARAQADELLRKAGAEADALLADAQAKAEKAVREADISAAATRQKADQHAMLTRQQLSALLNNCQSQYERLLEGYKAAALQAAASLQKAQEQMAQLPTVFSKIEGGVQKLSESKQKKD